MDIRLWKSSAGYSEDCSMAYLVVRVINRKRLLQSFIVPGLILVPLVFFLPAFRDMAMSNGEFSGSE